ncbi:MAG TPA: methyltransferase [Chloroflexota bacterium]|nr:methyltransferase [Chloroflexota bacterium]
MDLWSMSDLCTPWCIYTVATLRIADHLAAGTTDVAAVAAAAGCDPECLHRVLRHLVGKGVFAETAPGQFALTDLGQGLRDPSQQLGLNLDGIGGRMAYAWSSLLTAVKTGQTAYREVFGAPFWEDLDAHPDVAASFDALMGPLGHGIPDPEVLLDGDWDSVRTVVDVGGGTGSLLAEVLRAHPALRGTLVDLPRTVARSDDTFKQTGVAERVTAIGQSFFGPLPVGADLYLLKNVLGDWPDREARELLKRCAEAARPNGRVVILGGISPDDARAPSPELLMLVLVGGKHRTLSEFRQLAGEADLAVRASGRQPSGRFVVECVPTPNQPG